MLRFNTILRSSFLLLDLFLLNATCVLSMYLCNLFTGDCSPYFSPEYILLINLIWLLITYKTKYYFTEITFYLLARKTISINLFHFLLVLLCFFLIQKYNTSRLQILIYYGLQVTGILLSRYLFLLFQPKIQPIKYDHRRVILVGNCELSEKAAAYFKRPDSGYDFVGYFGELNLNPSGNKVNPGSVDQCLEYAIANHVDEIYSTVIPSSNELLQELITKADQHFIRVKFIPNFDMFFLRSVSLKVENGLPVISLRKEPLENIENRFVKRIFDLSFSILFFVLFAWWIFPILAILIKLTSKGPVFFVQKRSGRNGEVFLCYKFRSMYLNEDAHEISADQDDERFTPIGRFLRKSNLDELPQFFNVLKGDMSVVGPRPHMLKHTDQYSKIINTFMVRHFLKPGISGWAQVNGYRGDLTGNKMSKRVEYDVWYLENWSFLLDLKIIFKTIWLTAKGDENAY
ncbi:MAG: undecaprenyl-phosphate glucose phosphotransferase [Lacibacter sp.]